MQFFQVGGGVAAFPTDHQIGPEGEHGFEIHPGIAADGGNPRRRGREIAVVHGADDALAGAGGEQRLGNVGRQADDAPGGGSQTDRRSGIVPDHDLRPCADGEAERNAEKMEQFHDGIIAGRREPGL